MMILHLSIRSQSERLRYNIQISLNFRLVFIILLIYLLPVSSQAESIRNQVIDEAGYFFKVLNNKRYNEAFNCLSVRLRNYYTFEEFALKAKRVHSAKILEFQIDETYNNLVRLKAKAKLQLWYEGILYHAVYRGRVNLIKEGKKWKLDSCLLEPVGTAKPVSGKGIDKQGIQFEL